MRDPFAFQGKARRHYFEGWYCKNVAPDGTAYSFIPGLSYDDRGTGHSFVQVIRGTDGATAYERYELSDFRAARDTFAVSVGPNQFSRDGISVELPGAFYGISGALTYGANRRLTSSPLRPGIMGWYRYVPFMECYHEVGSVSHSVGGTLVAGGAAIEFGDADGRGYLEKDWGTSMPDAWVWIQGNGFPDPADSVMISIARIPWLGGSFTGFLGFATVRDRLFQFGTYSRARITRLEVDGPRVSVTVQAGAVTVDVDGTRSHTGTLAAPVGGAMDRRIAESLDATLRLSVAEGGIQVTDATGGSAGIEVVGVVDSLVPPGSVPHGA